MFNSFKSSLEDTNSIEFNIRDVLSEMTGIDKGDINIEQDGSSLIPNDLFSLGLLLGYKFQDYVKTLKFVKLPGETDKILYFNDSDNYGICTEKEYNDTLPN